MPIPPELARACDDIAPAGDADIIEGRQARYVAAPASTGEASALLRAAAALGLTVVPRGAGRLQHWGNPPDSCDLIVDTRRLNRIIEHRTDDFTVTAEAGVLLPGLEQVVEAGQQTLALSPPRRAYLGTVGGLIATNAAGRHRERFGTPRDRLAALTAVRADGTVVRSADGGRAAGHDLVTLFAGSYGSLGLITEVTLRLEPLPGISGGIGVPCQDPEHAARLVEEASDPWIAPSGIEVLWPADQALRLIVMIQGHQPDYDDRWARVHELAGRPSAPRPSDATANAIRPDAPDHGGLPPALAEKLLAQKARIDAELRDPSPDTGTLLRVTIPRDRLAWALTEIKAVAADSGATASISGSAGVLEVKVSEEFPAPDVARFVVALRGELAELSEAGLAQAVVVYAPGDVRGLAGTYGPAPSLALALAVKDELDPGHRMAPGRVADLV